MIGEREREREQIRTRMLVCLPPTPNPGGSKRLPLLTPDTDTKHLHRCSIRSIHTGSVAIYYYLYYYGHDYYCLTWRGK